MTRRRLDARGLLCPMPVIRTQERVREMAPGEELEVLCTDPGALADIPAWCRIHGHEVVETEQGRDIVRIVVRVGGGGG
ncbi:sulfurtransferase TusA family protein [Inmirania thermothiophila]|uniref:tRNA 2-thiouridine synthesizing protein A n=1 Tax=Inmirania thermothiophila TaxID=1750597 RepID=A0A3N1Y6Q5_9GAMM|nr:sulfurtransferase TusA family protein [Inmirania thermothiophila]ROR34188.1 tRNA 2-thiouridine synthesizing protein A [Inmirania thermothiophila]